MILGRMMLGDIPIRRAYLGTTLVLDDTGPATPLVGTATAETWGASITVTHTTTAGSLLVMAVSGHAEADSITDDAGNTWTLAGSTADAGATSTQTQGHLWYCLDAQPVTQVTVTRAGGSRNWTAVLSEWSGFGTAVDVAVTYGTAPQVDAQAGDLIV